MSDTREGAPDQRTVATESSKRILRAAIESRRGDKKGFDPRSKEFLDLVPEMADEAAERFLLSAEAGILGSEDERKKILEIARFYMVEGKSLVGWEVQRKTENLVELLGGEDSAREFFPKLKSAEKEMRGMMSKFGDSSLIHVFTRIDAAIIEAIDDLQDKFGGAGK